MSAPRPIPAKVTDGQSAWDEFVSGVAATFEGNAALLPIIGLVLIVAIVVWLDWIAARWLVGRDGRRGGPDQP